MTYLYSLEIAKKIQSDRVEDTLSGLQMLFEQQCTADIRPVLQRWIALSQNAGSQADYEQQLDRFYQQLTNDFEPQTQARILHAWHNWIVLTDIASQLAHFNGNTKTNGHAAAYTVDTVFEKLDILNISKEDLAARLKETFDFISRETLTSHPTVTEDAPYIHAKQEISLNVSNFSETSKSDIKSDAEKNESYLKLLQSLQSLFTYDDDYTGSPTHKKAPSIEANETLQLAINHVQAQAGFLDKIFTYIEGIKDKEKQEIVWNFFINKFQYTELTTWTTVDQDNNFSAEVKYARQLHMNARQAVAIEYQQDLQQLMTLITEESVQHKIQQIQLALFRQDEESLTTLTQRLQQLNDGLDGLLADVIDGKDVKPGSELAQIRRILARLKINARTYGLHLLKLDFRQEGAVLTKMMTELLADTEIRQEFGLSADKKYNDISEEERLALVNRMIIAVRDNKELQARYYEQLMKSLKDNYQPAKILADETQGFKHQAIETLNMLKFAAEVPECNDQYTIASVEGASQMLEMLFLQNICGVHHQGIMPLCEDKYALENVENMLDEAFAQQAYRDHVFNDCGGFQRVMLALSDTFRGFGLFIYGAMVKWNQGVTNFAIKWNEKHPDLPLKMGKKYGGAADTGRGLYNVSTPKYLIYVADSMLKVTADNIAEQCKKLKQAAANVFQFTTQGRDGIDRYGTLAAALISIEHLFASGVHFKRGQMADLSQDKEQLKKVQLWASHIGEFLTVCDKHIATYRNFFNKILPELGDRIPEPIRKFVNISSRVTSRGGGGKPDLRNARAIDLNGFYSAFGLAFSQFAGIDEINEKKLRKLFIALPHMKQMVITAAYALEMANTQIGYQYIGIARPEDAAKRAKFANYVEKWLRSDGKKTLAEYLPAQPGLDREQAASLARICYHEALVERSIPKVLYAMGAPQALIEKRDIHTALKVFGDLSTQMETARGIQAINQGLLVRWLHDERSADDKGASIANRIYQAIFVAATTPHAARSVAGITPPHKRSVYRVLEELAKNPNDVFAPISLSETAAVDIQVKYAA